MAKSGLENLQSALGHLASASGSERRRAPCSEGYNTPGNVFVTDDTVWDGDLRGLRQGRGAAWFGKTRLPSGVRRARIHP